ncbi:MAG: hypothetical protein ACE5OZ_16195 [Candidatus Heimdallarchaeota archaeon]
MVTTLLEKIENYLSEIKRPCEVSLKIVVLSTFSDQTNIPHKTVLDEIFTNLHQEALESRRVVLEYIRLGRIQFHNVPFPKDTDLMGELETELMDSDGVLILTGDSPESMVKLEQVLTYLLEKIRRTTQIAVCAEITVHAKGIRFLHWFSQLDMISQIESRSQSVQIYGLNQNSALEVLGWLGDLLDGRAVLQGCTIHRIYVYDESGVLVAYFGEDGRDEGLTDPVLVAAIYRALEMLFFEQQGIALKQLSLDSAEYEGLILAAVRYMGLGALFVCAGTVNQTLIWQIGTKILQAIQQERSEGNEEIEDIPEVHYIEGRAFFEQLKPHLLGKCVKCRDLLEVKPSEVKFLSIIDRIEKKKA